MYIPLRAFYQKSPLRFFCLVIFSAVVTAFLTTGFGLASIFPGLLVISHGLFALASLVGGGQAFTAFITSLLIALFFYETIVILNALIIPGIKTAVLALYRFLYYISEIRFDGNIEFSRTNFTSEHHVSLDMPAKDRPIVEHHEKRRENDEPDSKEQEGPLVRGYALPASALRPLNASRDRQPVGDPDHLFALRLDEQMNGRASRFGEGPHGRRGFNAGDGDLYGLGSGDWGRY